MDPLKLHEMCIKHKDAQYVKKNIIENEIKEENFIDLIGNDRQIIAKLVNFCGFYSYQLNAQYEFMEQMFDMLISEHNDKIKNDLRNYILPHEIKDFKSIKILLGKLALIIDKTLNISNGDLICEIAKQQKTHLNSQDIIAPEKLFNSALGEYGEKIYSEIVKELFKTDIEYNILDKIVTRGETIDDFTRNNKQNDSANSLLEIDQCGSEIHYDIALIQSYVNTLDDVYMLTNDETESLIDASICLNTLIEKVRDVEQITPSILKDNDIDLQDKINNFIIISRRIIDSIATRSLQSIFHFVHLAKEVGEKKINPKSRQNKGYIQEEEHTENLSGNNRFSSRLEEIKKSFADAEKDDSPLLVKIGECINGIEKAKVAENMLAATNNANICESIFICLKNFLQKELYKAMIGILLRTDNELINLINTISKKHKINKQQIESDIVNIEDVQFYTDDGYVEINFQYIGNSDTNQLDKFNSLTELIESKVSKQLNLIRKDIGSEEPTTYQHYCLNNLIKCEREYEIQKTEINDNNREKILALYRYIDEAKRIIHNYLDNKKEESPDKYMKTVATVLASMHEDKPIEELENIVRDVEDNLKNSGDNILDKFRKSKEKLSTVFSTVTKILFKCGRFAKIVLGLTILITLGSGIPIMGVSVIAGSALLITGATLCTVLIALTLHNIEGKKKNKIFNAKDRVHVDKMETLDKKDDVISDSSLNVQSTQNGISEISIPQIIVDHPENIVNTQTHEESKEANSIEQKTLAKSDNPIYAP